MGTSCQSRDGIHSRKWVMNNLIRAGDKHSKWETYQGMEIELCSQGGNRDWAMGSTWARLVEGRGRETLVRIKHVKREATNSTCTQNWHQSKARGTTCMTGALSWTDTSFLTKPGSALYPQKQLEHKKLLYRTDNRLAKSLWIKGKDCMDKITVKVCYKSSDQDKKADEDLFQQFQKVSENDRLATILPLWHLLKGLHSRRQNLKDFGRFQGKQN